MLILLTAKSLSQSDTCEPPVILEDQVASADLRAQLATTCSDWCNGNIRSALGLPQFRYGLGSRPRPSGTICPQTLQFRSISSVAGAWAPAFVERPATTCRQALFVVSPELGLRPSLSGEHLDQRGLPHPHARVAGAWAPAFVERKAGRASPRTARGRRACRRGLGSGLSLSDVVVHQIVEVLSQVSPGLELRPSLSAALC